MNTESCLGRAATVDSVRIVRAFSLKLVAMVLATTKNRMEGQVPKVPELAEKGSRGSVLIRFVNVYDRLIELPLLSISLDSIRRESKMAA